jgi:hypothetical protein
MREVYGDGSEDTLRPNRSAAAPLRLVNDKSNAG